jgi:DNA polymerase iota
MTDIVDYNMDLINPNDLPNSFFCLSKKDPTVGFKYDASKVAGQVFGEGLWQPEDPQQQNLGLRLTVGSHLAEYIRLQLKQQKGYTATVGISTTKVLSKLVGNLHKPQSQTTLLPPYESLRDQPNNVQAFLDSHEIGKIPGIGFKMAQKLRQHVLQRQPGSQEGWITTFTVKDNVSVKDVRTNQDMSVPLLDKLLNGSGFPHGIGLRVWGLIHGIDESDVGQARDVPRQISIEDSYIRLDTFDEVQKELKTLTSSLIRRMHTDLVEVENALADPTSGDVTQVTSGSNRRWIAQPRTIRLSTRPRPAANPDGSKSRSFNRLSRSAPAPSFMCSLTDNFDALAERLVAETLMPLFRKLHPEKSGWDLSLVNVAVTNMAEVAGNGRISANGRDIGAMFRNQESVLKEWQVEDQSPQSVVDVEHTQLASNVPTLPPDVGKGSEDFVQPSQSSTRGEVPTDWNSEDESMDTLATCAICSAQLPPFAMDAHLRYHEAED